MQLELFPPDLSNKRVLLSLSGGLNSAALLCYLGTSYPVHLRPQHLYIFYAHLIEHSPGTIRFVRDCLRYARRHFSVTFACSRASVVQFFKSENMVPHPIFSPCSRALKIEPMTRFAELHGIEVDLVGYIRSERGRITRQLRRTSGSSVAKVHPLYMATDEDCRRLVLQEIGWLPDIYHIMDDAGRPVFKHNNCLPCKNMVGRLSPDGSASGDFLMVRRYFPSYYRRAARLSSSIGAYWGRNASFDGHCKVCED